MDAPSSNVKPHAPNLLSTALFIAAIVTISMAIGYVTRPGEWYADLSKPFFNPPSWVFGPVWNILYILIAIAGWRIMHRTGAIRAKAAWVVQMLLNWAWSPAFFGGEMPWLAVGIIVLLLLSILFFIFETWRTDRISAWLFTPYAAWVAFATLLNGSIAAMN